MKSLFTLPKASRRCFRVSAARRLSFLVVLLIAALSSGAQTNPTAVALPFTLSSQASATLPAGVAVHRFGSIQTTRTLSPANGGDLPNQGSGATTNSGGWYNLSSDGIGLLMSNSNPAGAVVVAINTTGLSNVNVAWKCKTQFQQASRDNSVALQYRVGTTGNFIDVGTTSTYSSTGQSSGSAAVSYSETLPAGANNQPVVQVRWIYWESSSSSGSRDKISVGTIAITAAAACTPPAGLAANNLTPGTADLSWNTVSGASGYEYVIDQTSANPAGAGTPINTTTYSASSLNASSAYYLHVRTHCGGTTYSSWATLPFVTPCAPPIAAITAVGPAAFCAGGQVALKATTGAGLSYQWLLNGAVIPTATDTVYTASTSGNYSVKVTNSTSCSDTSSAITVTAYALPVPVITATSSTTFCDGSQVVLDANSGTGWTYQWQLNGANVTGATADTLVTGIGAAYTVIVTDGNSCSDTSNTINVTVNSNPTISVTAGGPLAFCDGGSVLLDAGTASGLSYQWRDASGPVSGAVNATYTATTSGVYTVIATDGNSCADTSAPTTVAVHTVPAAMVNAGGPLVFCSGSNVQLSAPAGTGFLYQWMKSGAPVPGATGINFIATTTGTYSVIVTNSNNCSDTSASTTTMANPTPSATVTAGGPLAICPGENVVLSNASGTGYNYQWQDNSVNIPATSSSYTATAAGAYRLIVSGGNGCADTSAVMTVTVNPKPVAAGAAAGATTICDGLAATLNAITPGTGLTYQWLLNGNPLAGAVSAVHNAVTTGQYRVIVRNSFGCADTAAAIGVTVNPTPGAVITYNTPLVFCEGTAVVLTGSPTSGLTLQWFRNGTAITGATSSFYTAAQTGVYTLHTTNSFGCVGKSDTVDVTVHPRPQPAIVVNGFELITGSYASYQWYRDGQAISGATAFNYTVTANGGYSVEVTDANGCSNRSQVQFINTVGVGQVPGVQPGVRIYPNPAADLLHIDAPAGAFVRVLDAWGRTVYSGQNVSSLNLSAWADGLYFIAVEGPHGAWVVREKVLKQVH